MLCPPSISANSTMGEAILFGACLTGFQGLQGPLGWAPAQATAGAAAEVTVAGAASSSLPRDGVDICTAANTIAGARGRSRIFERGQASAEGTRIEAPQAPRGMGGEGLFQKYFVSILGLEIAYYGAFGCHVANISTLQSTCVIYTVYELLMTHMCASQPYRAWKLTVPP